MNQIRFRPGPPDAAPYDAPYGLHSLVGWAARQAEPLPFSLDSYNVLF